MKWRWITAALLMLELLHSPLAQSTPVVGVQTEITYLLDYVGKSGCSFYRNGSWYDALSAQQHLRDKYNYLVSLNQIASTEEFIEKVATQSSLTHMQYQVKCRDEAALASKLWLHDELLRWRLNLIR